VQFYNKEKRTTKAARRGKMLLKKQAYAVQQDAAI
jgi:hypothetical protein